MEAYWTDTRVSMRKALFTGMFGGGVPTIHRTDHAAHAKAERLAKSSRSSKQIMHDLQAGNIHLSV